MTVDHELNEIIRIARLAAHRVRAIYATAFTVDLKKQGDRVTSADCEANALICEALSASFPNDAILAEESVPASTAEVARLVSRPRVWFVDPLDGTHEFVDRINEFSVMIGLAAVGRAALGVIAMPYSGEIFAGRIGSPAFMEHANGERHRLSVSNTSDPHQSTMVVSRSHRPSFLNPLIEKLGVKQVVPCGSVGVKVSRLVSKQADLYLHDGGGAKRWDTCAPEAVLVAAGGHFSDLGGSSINYASADLVLKNGLVATNSALYKTVLAALAEGKIA